MKIKGSVVLCAAGFFASLSPVNAQIYSSNIVGYANLTIYAGNNLVANQFDNGSGNTLDSLFQAGVPEGATFAEWNPANDNYLPVSTYDVNSGWSINYTLAFGQGGLLNSPATFTNTYVGGVWPGFSLNGPFTPPLITDKGLFLLSSYVPLDPSTFYDVVGRAPQDGEYVEILNALSQMVSTTTYQNGAWDNGTPTLNVGESAFFGLGGDEDAFAPVPEPSVFGLFGIALAAVQIFRISRR